MRVSCLFIYFWPSESVQYKSEIGMKQKDLLTQLQIRGVDLNASGLSKLEGQVRSVCDTELIALSEVLGVSVNWLLGLE